jgi:hypothetical protein
MHKSQCRNKWDGKTRQFHSEILEWQWSGWNIKESHRIIGRMFNEIRGHRYSLKWISRDYKYALIKTKKTMQDIKKK